MPIGKIMECKSISEFIIETKKLIYLKKNKPPKTNKSVIIKRAFLVKPIGNSFNKSAEE